MADDAARAAALADDPSDEEREVRDALARRDYRRALDILMDDYGTSVLRYCTNLVRDPDLASDLRQTTFVQAYRDLARFGGRSSLRTWLLGIARHRCLDALRSRHRTERREVHAPLELAADPTPGPAARAEVQDLAVALRRCLEKLKSEVREAVVLRYQDDLSYPEIAEITREQPATLQARVARALPILRQCLERQGLTP